MSTATYSPFLKIATTERKSHADLLAEQFRRMIVHGELVPGKAFPNETVLCKQLNVSRSTLREAYKILEIQGYISRGKNGTFVKETKSVAIQGSYSASLELSQYNELIEFVSLLEGESVYLAAENAAREQLEEIERYKKLCEENKDIPGALEEYNYGFHLSIRVASGNSLLVSALSAAYETFNQKIIKKLLSGNTEAFVDQCLRQHDQLFQAVKDGNADEARRLAREHLLSDIEQYKTEG